MVKINENVSYFLTVEDAHNNIALYQDENFLKFSVLYEDNNFGKIGRLLSNTSTGINFMHLCYNEF